MPRILPVMDPDDDRKKGGFDPVVPPLSGLFSFWFSMQKDPERLSHPFSYHHRRIPVPESYICTSIPN